MKKPEGFLLQENLNQKFKELLEAKLERTTVC